MMAPGQTDSTLVLGPAYLDRVIRVNRPLHDPGSDQSPLDLSVDGQWVRTGNNEWAKAVGVILLIDPTGRSLKVRPPDFWLGRRGTVLLSRGLDGLTRSSRFRNGVDASDALGGMGAGYAAALGGTLISALGSLADSTSQFVVPHLERAGISHEAVRLNDWAADWTLLISSGPHGDKLAVGFRGCHAAWTDFEPWRDRRCLVRVVAALPNRVVPAALGDPAASQIRAFFPNVRNMLDRADPLAGYADRFHFLSCNRGEWNDLGDQASALDPVPIVAITDGPRGAEVRFLDAEGSRDQVVVPAFPRTVPIVDTNRAGEAFAANLLTTLVEAGWTPGPTSADLIRRAAWRGSAASALVLGRSDFGFPTRDEVDRAVAVGRVG